MKHSILTAEIRYPDDIVAVRQRARQVSALVGFDEMEQARIATAVSEIARNALNYAGSGRVEFLVEDGEERHPLLTVSIADEGPGIPHLNRVLEGRFESATGAGLGIRSARRLMDHFHIESEAGRGTRVLLSKRFPRTVATVTSRDVSRISRELARRGPQGPFEEIRQQNQDLIRALEELRARQEELVRLNRELEDTNRGVVALYAELDEKASHLRRSDELKSRFLSNMSHEFRTPLNSILALSRLLLQRVDGDLTDEQAKQLTFIQKNAQDLSELVNDLLDLAKVEAGRITVNAGEVSVENLFGGLRGMFRPLLVNPLVTLTFEEPAGVPEMFTDEGKISQILRNFISNALKFTESGQVVVSAAHDPANETVAFSVADTGIGIAPQDQHRIFEEFVQLDSPIQRQVKGTGLGLPLSRKLAELLGGGITVQSEPGRGSVFSAVLPVVYPGAIAAGGQLPVTDLTRHPVLVIGDDRESVVLYEKFLKGTGFQVIPAGTPGEARRRVEERKPVAILLDAALPRGASWELLMELKRDEATAGIPVFAAGTTEDAQKAFALGADDCFVKPVDRKRLLERLRSLAKDRPGGRILMIDDDEVSRYILRDLLSDTRYQVMDAPSGEEGLKLARERRPNAILLDLVMPGLNGFEVLKQLAADPSTREIPVIIVTSKTLDENERALLSGRVIAVLSKESASRQEAIARVREALTAAEMRTG